MPTISNFRHMSFSPSVPNISVLHVKFYLKNFFLKLGVTLLMKNFIILIKKIKS